METCALPQRSKARSRNLCLHGIDALEFARKYGALFHLGESPPLTWPSAMQLLLKGADADSAWLPRQPQWPAFALTGAWQAALCGRSGQIVVSSAHTLEIAAKLISQLARSLDDFELRHAQEGRLVYALQGATFISIRRVLAPGYCGPPWLPEHMHGWPTRTRPLVDALMRRALHDAIDWPAASSFGWLGPTSGGETEVLDDELDELKV